MFSIDLHMHSSHSSDGEIAPATLVRMARDAGLDVISVTDHNKTSAIAEAIAAGKAAGVMVIPGIEIDCRYGDLEIHLLGHFIDHSDSRYAELWADIEEQEKQGRAAHGFGRTIGNPPRQGQSAGVIEKRRPDGGVAG